MNTHQSVLEAIASNAIVWLIFWCIRFLALCYKQSIIERLGVVTSDCESDIDEIDTLFCFNFLIEYNKMLYQRILGNYTTENKLILVLICVF